MILGLRWRVYWVVETHIYIGSFLGRCRSPAGNLLDIMVWRGMAGQVKHLLAIAQGMLAHRFIVWFSLS